ncbi:MAG: hypothetical protein WBF17_25685, partial [Phycisphaerae bacterium]
MTRHTVVAGAALLLALAAGVRAADWEMAAMNDGTVAVMLKKAPVVKASYCFWGAKWKYAGAKIGLGQKKDGAAPLAGSVRDLGIAVAGDVTSPAANKLRYTWNLQAGKALSGVIGGGMEFRLSLNDPAFGAKIAGPTLLPDNTGWRWPVGGGQEVRVEFAGPIANVYFERGNKAQVRCMFVGQELAEGTHTVV